MSDYRRQVYDMDEMEDLSPKAANSILVKVILVIAIAATVAMAIAATLFALFALTNHWWQ